MSDDNSHNLLYFESPSMRGLYECMEDWQNTYHKRLLSVSIQQDAGNFCCIALTNAMEVLIRDIVSQHYAHVDGLGRLQVYADPRKMYE